MVADTPSNRGMVNAASHMLKVEPAQGRELEMRLNTIKPGAGSKRTRLRVGRGASAGQGKTCGRGVKGQRARKGGYHKVGFEGGQMPLQRRLPKIGFRSAMKASRAELTLDRSDARRGARSHAGRTDRGESGAGDTKLVKIILSGAVTKAYHHQGQGDHRDQGRQERGRIGRRPLRGLSEVPWPHPPPTPPRH